MGFSYGEILDMTEAEKDGYFSACDRIRNGGGRKLPVKRP